MPINPSHSRRSIAMIPLCLAQADSRSHDPGIQAATSRLARRHRGAGEGGAGHSAISKRPRFLPSRQRAIYPIVGMAPPPHDIPERSWLADVARSGAGAFLLEDLHGALHRVLEDRPGEPL